MKCLSCAQEFDFFSSLMSAPHKKLLLYKMFAAQNRQHVVQNVDSFNCGGRVSSTFFNRRFQRRKSLGCCSPCRSFQSTKQNSYLSSSSSSHEGRQHKQQQSINKHIQFRGTNVSTISRRRKSSSLVVVRVSSESSSSNGDDDDDDTRGEEEKNGDVSMSFAEELRKRGIKEASDIKSDDENGEGTSSSSSSNPFANVAKAVKSPFGSSDSAVAPKPPPRFAQPRGDGDGGANKEEDDQLRKSRLLNSEGLEGFPTRAGELLKLAVTSTASFAPLIAVISVITIGTWSIFGADFIHGGVSRDFGGGVPKYVAPETLLAEPTVDVMVPLRSPNVVAAEY